MNIKNENHYSHKLSKNYCHCKKYLRILIARVATVKWKMTE